MAGLVNSLVNIPVPQDDQKRLHGWTAVFLSRRARRVGVHAVITRERFQQCAQRYWGGTGHLLRFNEETDFPWPQRSDPVGRLCNWQHGLLPEPKLNVQFGLVANSRIYGAIPPLAHNLWRAS
jgi:hypothetical protein